MSNLNLDSYFSGALMAIYNIANDIDGQNNFISNFACHVEIVIKIAILLELKILTKSEIYQTFFY